jgi:hypothetical protein
MLGSSQLGLVFSRCEISRLLPLLCILVLSLGVGAGCHKGGGSPEETQKRIRRLLYPLIDYVEATSREGKGKPNEEGFKAFLAGLSPQKLSDLQITNTPDLFISPRDQKPLVINYGIPPTGGSVPAIWEQTGLNGRRYVVLLDGKVEEVDDETFRKMAPAPKR